MTLQEAIQHLTEAIRDAVEGDQRCDAAIQAFAQAGWRVTDLTVQIGVKADKLPGPDRVDSDAEFLRSMHIMPALWGERSGA